MNPGAITTNGSGAKFTVSNLSPGTYTFSVADAVTGCVSVTTSAVVIDAIPTPPTAPLFSNLVQPSCAVGGGRVDVSGLPGVGNWVLTRNPGAVSTAGVGANTTLTNIPAGTYTYTVTVPSTACTSPVSAPITIIANATTPATPVLDSITQIKCGQTTGAIHLSNLPGSWTLFMNPGGVTTSGVGAATSITNLAPGTYTFAVRNETTGCVSLATSSITIAPIPTPPTAPVIGTIVHPTCTAPAGSVDLNGLPATGNWVITCTPGGLTQAGSGTSTTFTGLGAGSYTFTVTTVSTACTSVASSAAVLLPDPNTPPTPTIGKITQPDCLVSLGTLVLNTLPSAPWTLTMNPGNVKTAGSGASYTVANLAPGTYTFFVKNETTSCISLTTANVVINPIPAPPTAPLIDKVDQPSCSSPGGVVTFKGLPAASWTLTRLPDSVTTVGTNAAASVIDVPVGTFTYTVTDGITNCTSVASAPITIVANPNVTPTPVVDSIIHPKCTIATGKIAFSGLPTGAWTITQSPGAVAIPGSGSKFSLSTLSPGTYSFSVKDETTGCVSLPTSNLVINPLPSPPAEPVIVKITQPSCAIAGGIVDVSGLPDTDPWIITRKPDNYTFSGKGKNTSLVNLPGGTFTFTVTNVTSQCTSVESAGVTIVPNMSTPATPATSITQPTCADNKAKIVVSNLPQGSWTLTMKPGNVSISGSGLSYTINNLNPGKYNFVVRNDANSCMSLWTDTVVVNAIPTPPSAPTATITQPSATAPLGVIDFAPLAGVEYGIGGSYQASPTFTNVMPGSYTLTVRNLTDSTCFASATSKVDIIAAGPIALPDFANVNQNDSVAIAVAVNDAFGTYIPQGAVKITTNSVHGSVEVDANKTPNDPTDDKIIYRPDLDYVGEDSLVYTVCSQNNLCSSAMVKITVNSLSSIVSVVKKATVPAPKKDGTYEITYSIAVTNKTANPIRNIQIEDDLTKTFVSPLTFHVETVTSGNKFTANQLYDGKIEIKTLQGADRLQGFESDTVRIRIKIYPNGFVGTISNQALMSGYSDVNGPIRKFRSDNGNLNIDPQPTLSEIKQIIYNANNGFTPNGDGFNDTYVIVHSEEIRLDISIFNRWGSLVYESKDYKNDWNGKGMGIYSDQDMPTGTYYYVVKLYDVNNALMNQYKGYLTLKR
jgi:gliding motility-associated-like protein